MLLPQHRECHAHICSEYEMYGDPYAIILTRPLKPQRSMGGNTLPYACLTGCHEKPVLITLSCLSSYHLVLPLLLSPCPAAPLITLSCRSSLGRHPEHGRAAAPRRPLQCRDYEPQPARRCEWQPHLSYIPVSYSTYFHLTSTTQIRFSSCHPPIQLYNPLIQVSGLNITNLCQVQGISKFNFKGKFKYFGCSFMNNFICTHLFLNAL